MKKIFLSDYSDISFEDLQKVSAIYDKIEDLVCGTETIHEDLIEYMLNPFINILEYHGVNLNEDNF